MSIVSLHSCFLQSFWLLSSPSDSPLRKFFAPLFDFLLIIPFFFFFLIFITRSFVTGTKVIQWGNDIHFKSLCGNHWIATQKWNSKITLCYKWKFSWNEQCIWESKLKCKSPWRKYRKKNLHNLGASKKFFIEDKKNMCQYKLINKSAKYLPF